MPQTIVTPLGRKVTLFSQTERDFYVNSWGKSAKSFTESPEWVKSLMGWDKPLYAYHTSITQDGVFWDNNFGAPVVMTWKPGFIDIFTNGAGELHGEEVREQEAAVFGDNSAINDHYAVSAYNDKLRQDHKLYGEDLDYSELADVLSAGDLARMKQVDDWVEKIAGARPIYFSFQTDKVISEDVVHVDEFGIPHIAIRDAAKVPSIGFAFPGEKCLKRDLFVRGVGDTQNYGVETEQLPGRDRWFRVTGVNSLAAFLYSPSHTLSAVIMDQLLHGKKVRLPMSPIVPPSLIGR